MRRAIIAVILAAMCAGCPKKDTPADAAPEASAAPSVSAAPAPTAKNAASVGRFPGETKLANEKDKIVADAAILREGTGTGTVVATLKKGNDVTKVARN